MKNLALHVVVCCGLLVPALAWAQDLSSTTANITNQELRRNDSSTTAVNKPYEIIIQPTLTRTHLRGLIQTVEEDFFDRFNELNIDDDYDIVCYKHTPTMSHISERVCEPLFLLRARGENSSEVTFLLGSTSKDAVNQASGSANLQTPDVMKRNMKREFNILQEKMEELNSSDDELRSIGSVLAQLKARLKNFGRED